MPNPIDRYRKLEIAAALSIIHRYPTACKDLSLILRESYNKLPKNLQSLVFQDTLAAFRLLPQKQYRSAVSAVHLLIQSAEAVLPKQRRNQAVAEFKHAMVALKRRSKAHREEDSTTELPQDVLVHIFSFLDLESLASVGQVCWSWNFAFSDNQLWQAKFASFFGTKSEHSEIRNSNRSGIEVSTTNRTDVDWREAFQRAYKGKSSKRLASNRGYCGECETIVWLDNMKCSNKDHKQQSKNQKIVPVSSHQVVDYLLNGSSSVVSYSDSESESDEESASWLWAYPKLIGRIQNK